MTSRAQKALRTAARWEAGREMNVARGKAAQASEEGTQSKKAKLALGKSAAKDMINATIKKNRNK